MTKFPVVFLPGNVVQPSAGGDSPVKQLSYVQLRALRDAIGGGNIIARTPDPQARRFEFKNFLMDGLERFDQQVPLNDIVHLAQFSALVEGLIYGHIRLRMFDLRVFKFTIPNHLRYMGVLLNQQGIILGGTDPDILFFSASNASPQAFAELERANGHTRATNTGVRARTLLRGFKQKIGGGWHPEQILWMRLLDKLFFVGTHSSLVDFSGIADGWKQVGPLTLRVSVAADRANYSRYYFPVYEENYRLKALSAMSGDVSDVDGGLQLTIDGLPAARILIPQPDAIGNQDLLMLGAGTIETQDVVQLGPVRVNYAELRPRIQSIVNESGLEASHVVELIANDTPFSYPDVIRIPTQCDGFIAIEELGSRASSNFSERFLSQMRGKGISRPPMIPSVLPDLPLINEGSNCYFIDANPRGKALYVESFNGESVAELSTLGYALWSVFDKQAVVESQNRVMINDREILRFNGLRYEVSPNLSTNWPDYDVKAATLQRLKGVLEGGKVKGLFKAAVSKWLEEGYAKEIFGQASRPSRLSIGNYDWYVDNY